MPKITSHAKIRLRERCGLTGGEAQKFVNTAFKKGIQRKELDGRLRRYADALYLNYHNGNQIRLYGKNAFIFQNGSLITVLVIPERIIRDQFLKRRKEHKDECPAIPTNRNRNRSSRNMGSDTNTGDDPVERNEKMREILFRGKRIDNGEWCFGGFYQEPIDEIKNGRAFIIGGSLANVGNAYEVDPNTIGQYTGRPDKNCTKIFEGDICELTFFFDNWKTHENHIGKVTWREYGWYFTIEDANNGDWYFPFNSTILNFENVEVISNIHENTEEERIVFGVKL